MKLTMDESTITVMGRSLVQLAQAICTQVEKDGAQEVTVNVTIRPTVPSGCEPPQALPKNAQDYIARILATEGRGVCAVCRHCAHPLAADEKFVCLNLAVRKMFQPKYEIADYVRCDTANPRNECSYWAPERPTPKEGS